MLGGGRRGAGSPWTPAAGAGDVWSEEGCDGGTWELIEVRDDCGKGDGVLALTGLRASGLDVNGAEAEGIRPRAVGTGPTKPDDAASMLDRPPDAEGAGDTMDDAGPVPGPDAAAEVDCAPVSRLVSRVRGLLAATFGGAMARIEGFWMLARPAGVPATAALGIWLGPPSGCAGGWWLALLDRGEGDGAGVSPPPFWAL